MSEPLWSDIRIDIMLGRTHQFNRDTVRGLLVMMRQDYERELREAYDLIAGMLTGDDAAYEKAGGHPFLHYYHGEEL